MDWTPVTDWLLEHGTRILIILLAWLVLWLVVRKFLPRFIRRTLTRTMEGETEEAMQKRTNTLRPIFVGAGSILIAIIVLFMILAELDISIAPVLAGFGIAGIAVGFGAQFLIRDLIAGFFILLENQYRVGDVARVADIAGLVEEIHLRKTVLRDLDGIVHHVPNGEIRVASNYTKKFGRVNLDVPVAYGTDLDHAFEVINRVGQEMVKEDYWRDIILDVPKVLRVNDFGDSGIDIKILGDTKPIRQWEVTGELRRRIKKAFDEEGIEIPWPHTKVYFGDALRQVVEEKEPPGRLPEPEVVEKAPPRRVSRRKTRVKVLPPESEE